MNEEQKSEKLRRLAHVVATPLVIASIPVALLAVTFGADDPKATFMSFLLMSLPFLLAIPPSLATYAHKKAKYRKSQIFSIVSLVISFSICAGLLFSIFFLIA